MAEAQTSVKEYTFGNSITMTAISDNNPTETHIQYSLEEMQTGQGTKVTYTKATSSTTGCEVKSTSLQVSQLDDLIARNIGKFFLCSYEKMDGTVISGQGTVKISSRGAMDNTFSFDIIFENKPDILEA